MNVRLTLLNLFALGQVLADYNPKIDSTTFELWRLKVRKQVKTTERAHWLQYVYRGQAVSPWHDIPFWAGYVEDEKHSLLHFVTR